MTETRNEIILFDNNEFGSVRTMVIDGDPWFVGKDIAETLGYSNTRDALGKHVHEVDRADVAIRDGRQNRNMTIINESGLFSLIFGSKLPAAKEFTHWVTSEVLPSLRRKGYYAVPDGDNKIMLLEEQNKEILEELTALRGDLKEFKENIPLFPEDAEQVSNAVKRKGVQLLGGKDSPAYKDAKLRGKLYPDMYWTVKRNFNVTSYKKIKHTQLELALSIVAEYKPPIYIVQMIESANAQAEKTA